MKKKRKAGTNYFEQEEDEYTVKEGDTPESIALKFLDDENAYPLILSYNGMMREEIRPGAKIYFPRNA